MIKVRLVEVEGDPEEVLKVRQLFGAVSEYVERPNGTSESREIPSVGLHNGGSISVDGVLRVLTRRALHSNIKKVLKVLLQAPKGVRSEELAKAVGIDRAQLAGVLGAFGRRIANTPGWPVGAHLIEVRRDENDRKRYHLPSLVRSALEKMDL